MRTASSKVANAKSAGGERLSPNFLSFHLQPGTFLKTGDEIFYMAADLFLPVSDVP
jgi:hypothetical protein